MSECLNDAFSLNKAAYVVNYSVPQGTDTTLLTKVWLGTDTNLFTVIELVSSSNYFYFTHHKCCRLYGGIDILHIYCTYGR